MLKLLLFVCLLIVTDANRFQDVIGCQCQNPKNSIVYLSRIGFGPYSSSPNICNCGRLNIKTYNRSHDEDARKKVAFFKSLENGYLTPPTTGTKNSIIECMLDCSRRLGAQQNVAKLFNQSTFWLGLRFHCDDEEWRSDTNMPMTPLHETLNLCNDQPPADTCQVLKKTGEEWTYSVAKCDLPQSGFICQYPLENEFMAEYQGIIYLKGCPVDGEGEPTPTPIVVPHQMPVFEDSRIEPMIEEEEEDRLSYRKIVLRVHLKLEGLIQITSRSESLNVSDSSSKLLTLYEQLDELLSRGYVVPTGILEATGRVMKLVVDKMELETCLPNMAKTFTQNLVDVAETTINDVGVESWVNSTKRRHKKISNSFYPIDLVGFINEGLRKVHICLLNSNSSEISKEISSSDIVVSLNNRNKPFKTEKATVQMMSKTSGSEQEITSVLVEYRSLTKLLNSVQRKLMEQYNQSNAECVGELCSEDTTKYYVPGTSMITFTAYRREVKISLPIDYTIPLRNKSHHGSNLTYSCEFYDTSVNRWSSYGCRVRDVDEARIMCFCNHTTNFAVLLIDNDISRLIAMPCVFYSGIKILGYICNGLSVAFLLLTMVAFFLILDSIKKRENEHLITHFNLSVAALGLYVTLLFGDLAASQGLSSCISTAFFIHFFLLSVFSWMTVEGWMLNMYVVKGNIVRETLGWRKYATGWGIPFIISILTLLAGILYDDYVYYNNTIGLTTEEVNVCLLTYKHGLVWANNGPILISIAINFYFLIRVIGVVRKVSLDQKRRLPSISSKEDVDGNTITPKTSSKTKRSRPHVFHAIIKAFAKLFLILGLSWFLGWLPQFLVIDYKYLPNICQARDVAIVILLIIHSLVNGLQGGFIFLIFILKDSVVRHKILRKLESKKRNSSVRTYVIST